MAEPKPPSLRPALGLLLVALAPATISVAFLYCLPQGFDPVPLPAYSQSPSVAVPQRNTAVLGVSERVGAGLLPGPEDLAYDVGEGLIYTGCSDGWIRRVRVADGAVEDWVRVGGRPLGVALGPDGSLIVADPYQGVLMVKKDKIIDLLTDEAEGLKFGLTDGIDVASNGMIYFTDASYKYKLDAHRLDIFEGQPHGRLMSFNPLTRQTVVLVRDLYFPNGVSLSPDQQSLIFCETTIRKCKRYYIQGEKKGTIEIFIEDLPGSPDNVRYDEEGHYWIGLATGRTLLWDILMRYPFMRKLEVVLEKFVSPPHDLRRDSGVLCVSLDGKPLALYSDANLHLVTGGLRLGKHLYYCSLHEACITRIDITKHRANA